MLVSVLDHDMASEAATETPPPLTDPKGVCAAIRTGWKLSQTHTETLKSGRLTTVSVAA